MIELEDITYDRKKEIVETYKLIVKLEKISGVSIYHSASLKASIFIMLYNLLEGIVSQSFVLLFENISSNVNHINELTDIMQQLYYKMYQNKLSSAKDIKKFADAYSEIHKVTYDEYKKNVELYSGNLDARKIRDILMTIGNNYELHVKNEEMLVEIKSVRNKLAHGEYSYAEIGRGYTINEIRKKYIFSMFKYVNAYEKQIEIYLDGKKYLKH